MKKIKLLLCICILLTGILFPAQTVQASSSAIGDVAEFNNLSGNAKYLGVDYRDNYSLDIVETDISDGIGAYFSGMMANALNGMANALFFLERILSYLTVVVFYVSFNLNLIDLFGNQVSTIQQALNNSIFQPLFLLGCAAAFCVLIGRVIRQDLSGALGQIAKIIAIVMLSILVVTKSDVMLATCNNITKEISLEILVGVNSANGYSENINSFSAQAAGILWDNMVHSPWITMEFGYNASEDQVAKILTYTKGSDERKEIIAGDNSESFSADRAGERLGFTLFYIIPCFMKCGIYIVISLIQLVFQLMSIVYTFMAPLVLVISLFPGYDGMIGGWLRKILEIQISILILSLLIGILVRFDDLVFNWADSVGFGWAIALTIQIAIAIALFVNRNKVLTMMSLVQRGVSNPGYLRNRMRQGGNVYADMPKVANGTKNAAKWTAGKISKAVEWVEDKNVSVSWSVNPFLNATDEQKSEATHVTENVKSRQAKIHTETAERYVEPAGKLSNADSGSIREISENLTRSLGQLVTAMESASENWHDIKNRDHGGTEEAKRPLLTTANKTDPGKKDIAITVKSPHGEEKVQYISRDTSQTEMEIPQVDPGKSEMGGNGNLLQTARPTLEIVEQSDKKL